MNHYEHFYPSVNHFSALLPIASREDDDNGGGGKDDDEEEDDPTT